MIDSITVNLPPLIASINIVSLFAPVNKPLIVSKWNISLIYSK